MSTSLEQQLDAIMSASDIDTLQITGQRDPDGTLRFYAATHSGGICAYGSLMNLPTVREAVESGIKALNERRMAAPNVGKLAPMEYAA